MSKYRWVNHGSDTLRAVGINGDGTLYNPNGYPEELVRAAVLAADARRHATRSKAAKRAAATRARRTEARVYAIARKLAEGQAIGPRSTCVICNKRLDEGRSIERGIGSECWGRVLGAIHRTTRVERTSE